MGDGWMDDGWMVWWLFAGWTEQCLHLMTQSGKLRPLWRKCVCIYAMLPGLMWKLCRIIDIWHDTTRSESLKFGHRPCSNGRARETVW